MPQSWPKLMSRKKNNAHTVYMFHQVSRRGHISSLLLELVWIALIFDNGNTAASTYLLMISYFLL